jgi:signal transduction histidine kinase
VIDTNPADRVTSFASRPEIASALRGNVASGTRNPDARRLLTSRCRSRRTAGSKAPLDHLSDVGSRLASELLVRARRVAATIAVAIVVGLAVATFIAKPLRRLGGAAAVGAGDLTARAPEYEGPPEVRSPPFSETVAKLNQLLRSREEFVADASHQLGTPLTALRLRPKTSPATSPGGTPRLEGVPSRNLRASIVVRRCSHSRVPT